MLLVDIGLTHSRRVYYRYEGGTEETFLQDFLGIYFKAWWTIFLLMMVLSESGINDSVPFFRKSIVRDNVLVFYIMKGMNTQIICYFFFFFHNIFNISSYKCKFFNFILNISLNNCYNTFVDFIESKKMRIKKMSKNDAQCSIRIFI